MLLNTLYVHFENMRAKWARILSALYHKCSQRLIHSNSASSISAQINHHFERQLVTLIFPAFWFGHLVDIEPFVGTCKQFSVAGVGVRRSKSLHE